MFIFGTFILKRGDRGYRNLAVGYLRLEYLNPTRGFNLSVLMRLLSITLALMIPPEKIVTTVGGIGQGRLVIVHAP